jgi:hypothetical protein
MVPSAWRFCPDAWVDLAKPVRLGTAAHYSSATMLGEMGELPDIIEAAVNHASIRPPLAATYNRSRYRPQVAAALQRLADRGVCIRRCAAAFGCQLSC